MPSLAGLFFWMNRKIENINKITITKPLKLDCGKTIKNFPLAYETYGKLNENKDNAILVFHALTGDQFVTGTNPVTNKEGPLYLLQGSCQLQIDRPLKRGILK